MTRLLLCRIKLCTLSLILDFKSTDRRRSRVATHVTWAERPESRGGNQQLAYASASPLAACHWTLKQGQSVRPHIQSWSGTHLGALRLDRGFHTRAKQEAARSRGCMRVE